MLNQNKEWIGNPRCTTGKITNPNLNEIYYPCITLGSPLIVFLEGCDDPFIPIFSNVEKLNDYLKKTNLDNCDHLIGKVQNTNANILYEEISKFGRIMLDPIVINPHHTKWLEIIKKGNMWKYIDPQIN